MYEEITASCLIKVDLAGSILAKPDFGELNYGINKAGYVIHGAIHKARHDVACVIHTHTWAGMALSALDCGVLPISQTSMRFLKIGYHDYQGVVLDSKEEASLLADLVQASADCAPWLLTSEAIGEGQLDARSNSRPRSSPRCPPGQRCPSPTGAAETT